MMLTLEYFPKDLKKIKRNFKKIQMHYFIGSRFIGDKQRDNKYKRTYILQISFYLNYFQLIFNVKITDISTCYKLLSK